MAHTFPIIENCLKCTFRDVGIVGAKRRIVTVAVVNPGDEIRTGTLKAMIRQSGLPDKLFRK